ncbi:hypothetical protein GH714_005404 [Hevea brasiliensis]|uniref:Uncharacterized protein n=1 Tax=Hevea brasiliensis TaxID=3981 RepID=A0A6A6LC93_HEVBR|nr:hypothetical protein GH714_005404 [Hevea brasiliensis]
MSWRYFCYVRAFPTTWHKLDESKVIGVAEEVAFGFHGYDLELGLEADEIRGFGSSQGSTFGRGHSDGRGYGREIASDSDTAPSTEVDAGSQGEPCTAAEHFALSPSTLCFPPAIDISPSHDAADATAVAMGSVASSSAAPAGRLSSAPAASVDARSIFGSNDRPHITLDGNK